MQKAYIDKFIEDRMVALPHTINAMMAFSLYEVDEHKNTLCLRFPVTSWQLNPMHSMHGGLIATALDITMGCLSYACNGGHPNPTIEMQVRYLEPIKDQDVMLVYAQAMHIGKAIIQVEAHAYVKELCVAQASGSYRVFHQR